MQGKSIVHQIATGSFWLTLGAVSVGGLAHFAGLGQAQKPAEALHRLTLSETVLTEPTPAARAKVDPPSLTERPDVLAVLGPMPDVQIPSLGDRSAAFGVTALVASLRPTIALVPGIVPTPQDNLPVIFDLARRPEQLAKTDIGAPLPKLELIADKNDAPFEKSGIRTLDDIFDVYRTAQFTRGPLPELPETKPLVITEPDPSVERVRSVIKARPWTDAPSPENGAKPTSLEKAKPDFSASHFHRLRYHKHEKPSEIACVAELQLMASRAHVYFDSGSAKLDNRGRSAARLITAKAQSCPDAQLKIVGFTDPGGSVELNKKLSWQRANSVYKTLKETGFDLSGVVVESHMENHPEWCGHYEGIDRRVIFEVKDRSKG